MQTGGGGYSDDHLGLRQLDKPIYIQTGVRSLWKSSMHKIWKEMIDQ